MHSYLTLYRTNSTRVMLSLIFHFYQINSSVLDIKVHKINDTKIAEVISDSLLTNVPEDGYES